MVIMVIYMAQMTPETSRMMGTLSGNPIPLMLPVLLTLILIIRNRIRWCNFRLLILLLVFIVWSGLILIKYQAFANTADWSFLLFLFYAIIIAFIHVKVYGKQMLPIYEHIMVWICGFSLVFWLLNIILFNSLSPFFFQETAIGYNILYLYNWIIPEKAIPDSFALVLRNSGCSWEPGRFSIMVGLAILSNLLRNGIKFRKNPGILILLAAMFSTQSTTGFILALVLYTLFALSRINFKSIMIMVYLLVPLWFGISKLDFMQKKITEQLDFGNNLIEMNSSFSYAQSELEDYEYAGSLGRFESLYFDIQNTLHDPVLGYSRNPTHSYFNSNFSSNFFLTGGLARVFAQYGIPLAIILFSILGYSSMRLASDFCSNQKVALFLTILISAVSYEIWCVPIFTAMWLYGLFISKRPIKRVNSQPKRHIYIKDTDNESDIIDK